jgi:hypothetical protein
MSLVVMGLERMAGKGARGAHIAFLAAVMPVSTVVTMVPRFWPYQREEVRLIAERLTGGGPADAIYISANALPAWLFYTINWKSPDIDRLHRVSLLIRAGGPAFENASSLPSIVVTRDMYGEWAGVRELYGRSSGAAWRPYLGHSQGLATETWAREEADRIAAECVPMWIVLAHFRNVESELLQQLNLRGMRVSYRLVTPGAAAVLMEPAPRNCPGRHRMTESSA